MAPFATRGATQDGMATSSNRRPKLPYVFLRGSTFQYRRRVPKGSEERFGGKGEFVRTLGASTWKEAERELASVIQEFERLLRPPPPPVAALTDQTLDQDLAERLARRSLRQMRTMNAAAIEMFPSDQAGVAARDHRSWALDTRKALLKDELSSGWMLQARQTIKAADIDDSSAPEFLRMVARAIGEARAEYAMQLAFEL